MPVVQESTHHPDCQMSFLPLLLSVLPLKRRVVRRGTGLAEGESRLISRTFPLLLSSASSAGLAIGSEGEAQVLVTARTDNTGGLGLRGIC